MQSYKTLIAKVKILYLLVEYSEVNCTKKANEFICQHQDIKDNQFAIQLTENEVIKSFKESDNKDFEEFGITLENSLKPKLRKQSKTTTSTEPPAKVAKREGIVEVPQSKSGDEIAIEKKIANQGFL